MAQPEQPPLGELLGLVASGAAADDILAAFASLGTVPIEQLSARQWETLAEAVRREDDTYPANLAWRAAYGLRYLGHTERSFHFLTHADRTELDDAERAQFCAAWASSAWGSGDEEACDGADRRGLRSGRGQR